MATKQQVNAAAKPAVTAKSIVVKARKWNNPQIIAWVNNESIGMGMNLPDYLNALVTEIGNPAFILTQAQLLAKLQAASTIVEAEMHEKSALIV